MKYYTEIVPFELAKKLKEAGFPQGDYPSYGLDCDYDIVLVETEKSRLHNGYAIECFATTYAEAFDWFLEKGLSIEMYSLMKEWGWEIYRFDGVDFLGRGFGEIWHEAANAAIEKAIEILKEGK